MSKHTSKPGESGSILNPSSNSFSEQKTASISTTAHRSHAATRVDSPVLPNDSTEQWKSRHTAATFPKLHAIVYQYIDLLVKLHPTSSYAQQWRRLMEPKGDSQPTMFKRMNWTQIGNCLDIKDFHQYCNFVSKCPGISEYLKLIVHKGAFEVITLKPWKNIESHLGNNDHQDQDPDTTSTISTTNTVRTDQRECHKNMEDFQQLLQEFIPLFTSYITANQDTQYARLCEEWLNQDLNEASTVEEVYTVCQLTTLEDFYFLLRLSPALKKYMKFRLEDNKIAYQIISNPTPPPRLPSPTITPSANLTAASTIQDENTWSIFYHISMLLIRSWQPEKQSSHAAYAWSAAIDDGLNDNTTWEQFHELFELTLFQNITTTSQTDPSLQNLSKYTSTNLQKSYTTEQYPVLTQLHHWRTIQLISWDRKYQMRTLPLCFNQSTKSQTVWNYPKKHTQRIRQKRAAKHTRWIRRRGIHTDPLTNISCYESMDHGSKSKVTSFLLWLDKMEILWLTPNEWLENSVIYSKMQHLR